MNKWLTKDGLKAIFTDAVMAPVSLAKEHYKIAHNTFKNQAGAVAFTTFGQTPGLLLGAFLLSAGAGLIGGVAGFIIGNNILLAFRVINGIAEAKDSYPKIAAHAETLKP